MNLPTVSNSEGASGGSRFASTSQLEKAKKDTTFSEVKQGLNLPTSRQPPNNLPKVQPPNLPTYI